MLSPKITMRRVNDRSLVADDANGLTHAFLPCLTRQDPCFSVHFPCYFRSGICEESLWIKTFFPSERTLSPISEKFPEKFPVCRDFCPETGAIWTASPARHSADQPTFRNEVRMARKSGLFAHSFLSPDSRSAERKAEIPESLRQHAQIFPFCGDYRQRLVRSRRPPEDRSANSRTDKISNKT
jgi:hypothetical protein